MERSGARSVVLVALLAAGGCSVYDPALVARDAGHDAARPDAAAPDAGPCDPKRPPPRPTVADGPDRPEVVFGMKDVVLSQGGDLWRSIGHDLDGLCSVAPEPVTECVPVSPRAAREVDGERGIDNSFGHNLYPIVALTLPDFEAQARAAQQAGRNVLVVRVRGWNGADDDPRIDITLTQSVLGVPGVPDGGSPAPDGGLPPDADGGVPRWDGHDWFWARDDTFLDGDPSRPRVRDDNAYVTGRVAVFRIPDRTDVVFSADTQAVIVRLTDAIATARLSADALQLEDVTVAGRWSVTDILDTAERFGVCRGTTQYGIITNVLDTNADVRSTAGTGGPGVACDAVSVGVTFRGFRAHLGGVAPAPPIPYACARDGGA